VVGGALRARAAGLGVGAVAALAGRPLTTVREWLRRFAGRAEPVRVWFTWLLVAVAADPQVPDSAGSPVADAVAAIEAAGRAVADRFAVRMVTPWRVAGAASGGRLLSPGWPSELINTSSPWSMPM
jgi:hypothetical protein